MIQRRQTYRLLLLLSAAVVAICAVPKSCQAEFIFLGPTPYLSAADSPLPVDGSNPNFFLEDFEPDEPCVPGGPVICVGNFDAPGVRMTSGGVGMGASVESGANGFSAGATPIAIIGESELQGIAFEFDRDELGFWPTAVGVVLTGGAGDGSGLIVYDPAGNEADFSTRDIHVDSLMPSTYRFIGVTNPKGISRVMFLKMILYPNPPPIPRLDHFQYGLLIPEPPAAHLIACAVAILGAIARGRKRSPRY